MGVRMNIFVAFSIREEDEERNRKMQIMQSKLGQYGYKLHDSGQVFQKIFQDVGSWDAFIEKVSFGTDYYTREPLFDAVICMDMCFGRATGEIVSKFLSQNKIAMYADVDANEYIGVSDVVHHNEDDWQTGWSLRLAI